MKTLKTLVLTITAAALLGSTGLYAQEKAVANIPFAFTVLGKTLPAGQYSIQQGAITHKGLIHFQNTANGESVIVLAPASSASYTTKDDVQARVVFHRYGDRYFFSEVWSVSGGLTGKVQPSKLEKETRINSGDKQLALVTLPISVGK
jgi:hypothetical protein